MDTITTILAKDVTAKRHTLVYAALRMMELSGLDHSVCLDRIENEQEVIERANNTPYGLAAYFYTSDLGKSWRVSEQLDYGMVGLNTGIISTEMAPFGGIKESGIGREGSKYGVEDYLEMKYVSLAGIEE